MRSRRSYLATTLALGTLVLALPAFAKTIVGSAYADTLRGTAQADRMYGKGGNDRVFGLDGDDRIVGGPGTDRLDGGPGNDLLVARDGARDIVACGPGRDTAVVDERDLVRACESVQLPALPEYVLAGAGDIASDEEEDELTARLVSRIDPDVVFTTGDNAYPDGSPEDFREHYAPTWGRFLARTRPSPGNHDYRTRDAAGYFGYFGARAPGPYYSFDLGTWHVVSLNSELPMSRGSAQHRWLEQDLAASTAPCTLAYWHKPRFSSGKYRDASSVRPLWDLLYAEGAELVLAGHDHNYQRYPPLDPAGRSDPARGIREIVVGTGGKSLYALREDSRREAGQDRVFGVLKLTLRSNGYGWEFVPVSGDYSDSGSAPCR